MADEMILNAELARRIELSEAQAAVDAVEAMERLRPGSGAAVERVAGGFAVYCGANSPITQAVGMGLSGVVSEEEFARLENFYSSRGEAVRVETCPLADMSLIAHFGKNCYRVTEFSGVMARALDGSEHEFKLPDGVTISVAANDEIEEWTLSVAQGFAELTPVTPELLEVMRMFAAGRNTECYFARVNGKVAGGATLALRDGIAGLFGASTLPEFRNRGVQTALLHARLARAAEVGCDLAVSLALPGSTSQRNITRQGFRTLYTRVKFEREWDAKGSGSSVSA